MTNKDIFLFVIVIMAGTALTRFLPFIIFKSSKETSPYIKYLGKTIPFAMVGLLVVYCFKNVSLIKYPFALPEIIATVVIIILHIWKRNIFLSIGAGTAIYMILVQNFFI